MVSFPQPLCLSDKIWLVPCLLNRDSNTFLPLFRPYSLSIVLESQFRNVWQDEEDTTLKEMVEKHGIKHWKKISRDLNKSIYKGIPLRNSKQCRERWLNHLNPLVNKSDWTEPEDLLILESQLTMGNKWSEIARLLKGRTENAVKNRWKCLVNKAKKLSSSECNPIYEYITKHRDQKTQDKTMNSNETYFPNPSFGDIQFSTICDNMPLIYGSHHTPPISDISPTSFLFFNNP